ncbi:MAG: HD domain-containing phosphohydrolase [Vicinamibacterales bacterium]
MTTPAPPTAPRGTPSALSILIGCVIAVGFAIIGFSVYRLPQAPNPTGWIGLGVLAIVAASFALKVPGVPVYLSISDTFFITSALLFGPAPATLTIALDSLIVSWRRRNTARQLLFNVTSSATALWCGVQTFYLMSHLQPLDGATAAPDASIMIPLTCLAAVYFLLNSGLTAGVVGLSKGINPFELWREHFAMISLNHLAAASASFFLIVLAQSVGLPAIAAVVPLILVCYLAMRSWLGRVEDAQRHLKKVNDLYLSTVSALSTAIEAKDGVTSDHIQRVRAYALGLARALKLTDPQTVQAIEAAALLHDTGKLAIPEHILNKPGKLTASEFDTMKAHVDVGAEILSSIDFPYPVIPIVRGHHENWNGTGYPDGLRGEQIPIGARILSVVDCFDALTSDRPYRPAMSEEAAVAIIVERRGTMYDPHVVDTFLEVYREIAPPSLPAPQLQKVMGRIRQAHAATPVRVDPPPTPSAEPAKESEELLAFVSLARVATRTPTVTDIGALAWGHIRQIAPGASLALFTMDNSQTALVAQYTAGPAAAALAGASVNVGQRLTGWAAANARAVVNSDARLDVDHATEEGLRFALAVPLASEGAVVGVITLYAPEPFAEDRSRMLEMIAPHLATAVASARESDAAAATLTLRDDRRTRRSRSELRVVARA